MKQFKALLISGALLAASISCVQAQAADSNQTAINKLQKQITAFDASTNKKIAQQQAVTQKAIGKLQQEVQAQIAHLQQEIEQIQQQTQKELNQLNKTIANFSKKNHSR